MCAKKLCLVNVGGVAMVSVHELNAATNVSEEALHVECVLRSYGGCA